MSAPLSLKPGEARTILTADRANMDGRSKRILQKVVDKRPLSDDEVGELEGIVAGDKMMQRALGDRLEPTDQSERTLEVIDDAIRLNNERSEQAIERNNRRQVVLEMRMQHPPMAIRAIAKQLGVTTDTIMRDIKANRAKQAKILDVSNTQLLGQTLSQYDIIHGTAMALVGSYSSPMAKAALLRTALSALDGKTKVMGETGVIHRVPERSEILVAHADRGTVRDRVAKLIHAQEQRTTHTIDLHTPADRIDLDPDLTDAERIVKQDDDDDDDS